MPQLMPLYWIVFVFMIMMLVIVGFNLFDMYMYMTFNVNKVEINKFFKWYW